MRQALARPTEPKAAWSFAAGVALAGILLSLLGSGMRNFDWAADELRRSSAIDTAAAWSRYLVQTIPDLDRILKGEAPLGRDDRIINEKITGAAANMAQVSGFRVYDPGGILRIDRDERGHVASGEAEARLVARVLAEKAPLVDLHLHGENQSLRAFVPLEASGRVVGVTEVELDGTRTREAWRSILWALGSTLTWLIAAAFGIPLFAFLTRTREKLRADRQVAFLEAHEPMTGLLNRIRFVEMLEECLPKLRQENAPLAVMGIDLDGLKEINDRYGHDSGDAVIAQVGHAIRDAAGEGAIVSRLGGDEFSVALLRHQCEEADKVAKAILAAVTRPREVKGQSVAVSAHIGIACMPDDGEDVPRLLKAADLALDRARSNTKANVVHFDRAIESAMQRRRDLEMLVRDALTRDALELSYQPIVNAVSERLLGFEALLRLPIGPLGFISPAEFVPVAEEMGLSGEIGSWVVRRACAFAVDWPEHLKVAVNLSPAQFGEGGVEEVTRAALAETGLAPNRLQLEITEGLLLGDDPGILEELRHLRELGVSIVMDDFGTGYSSLSYLWRFPFDKLKIDRSFMVAFESGDPQVVNVLQSIMSLSRALHLRVTAEGVETLRQAEFVRSIGCDEVQGYHFGRPATPDVVLGLIARDAEIVLGLRALTA